MEPQPRSSRWRETFLVLSLAVGLACLIALYFLLVAGQYFLAVLAVLGGLIVLGCLQYLIWGWPMRRSSAPETRRPPWPR